jgi:hypothetical protein
MGARGSRHGLVFLSASLDYIGGAKCQARGKGKFSDFA